MATLKDIQIKIGAVKKTKQITRAMNMVAASRLRGAQTNMEAFRPYASKFSDVLGSLAERSADEGNPLLTPREETKKIHIILCTSDRGLCGGFNVNLTSKAETIFEERAGEDITISFTNFGKKGRDWCRNEKKTIDREHLGIVGANFGFNVAATEGRKLVEDYLAGTYDEVYVVYAEFVSMGRQVPVIKQILPIPPIEIDVAEQSEAVEDDGYLPEHICEPSPSSAVIAACRALL